MATTSYENPTVELPIPDVESPPQTTSSYSLADEFKLLKEWEQLCEDKAMMHTLSSSYYGTYVNLISIPSIILASIGSIGTIVLSSNEESRCEKEAGTQWVILGLSTMSLIATATQTVVQTLGLSELSTKNELSASHYEKLVLEIKMHISVRPDGAAYRSLSELVKSVKRQIDTLIDTSPSIPKHIERRVATARIDHAMFRL